MRWKYPAVSFVVLLATWFLWSGHTDPLLVSFGIVSCAGVVALSMHLRILDDESLLFDYGLRPFVYVPWLLWEITKANFAVAKLILQAQPRLSPKLLFVRPSQQTALAQVIYANSITLTPGTIALDIRQGRLLVHALTEETAYDLAQGEMDRRVTQLEGRGHRADRAEAAP